MHPFIEVILGVCLVSTMLFYMISPAQIMILALSYFGFTISIFFESLRMSFLAVATKLNAMLGCLAIAIHEDVTDQTTIGMVSLALCVVIFQDWILLFWRMSCWATEKVAEGIRALDSLAMTYCDDTHNPSAISHEACKDGSLALEPAKEVSLEQRNYNETKKSPRPSAAQGVFDNPLTDHPKVDEYPSVPPAEARDLNSISHAEHVDERKTDDSTSKAAEPAKLSNPHTRSPTKSQKSPYGYGQDTIRSPRPCGVLGRNSKVEPTRDSRAATSYKQSLHGTGSRDPKEDRKLRNHVGEMPPAPEKTSTDHNTPDHTTIDGHSTVRESRSHLISSPAKHPEAVPPSGLARDERQTPAQQSGRSHELPDLTRPAEKAVFKFRKTRSRPGNALIRTEYTGKVSVILGRKRLRSLKDDENEDAEAISLRHKRQKLRKNDGDFCAKPAQSKSRNQMLIRDLKNRKSKTNLILAAKFQADVASFWGLVVNRVCPLQPSPPAPTQDTSETHLVGETSADSAPSTSTALATQNTPSHKEAMAVCAQAAPVSPGTSEPPASTSLQHSVQAATNASQESGSTAAPVPISVPPAAFSAPQKTNLSISSPSPSVNPANDPALGVMTLEPSLPVTDHTPPCRSPTENPSNIERQALISTSQGHTESQVQSSAAPFLAASPQTSRPDSIQQIHPSTPTLGTQSHTPESVQTSVPRPATPPQTHTQIAMQKTTLIATSHPSSYSQQESPNGASPRASETNPPSTAKILKRKQSDCTQGAAQAPTKPFRQAAQHDLGPDTMGTDTLNGSASAGEPGSTDVASESRDSPANVAPPAESVVFDPTALDPELMAKIDAALNRFSSPPPRNAAVLITDRRCSELRLLSSFLADWCDWFDEDGIVKPSPIFKQQIFRSQMQVLRELSEVLGNHEIRHFVLKMVRCTDRLVQSLEEAHRRTTACAGFDAGAAEMTAYLEDIRNALLENERYDERCEVLLREHRERHCVADGEDRSLGRFTRLVNDVVVFHKQFGQLVWRAHGYVAGTHTAPVDVGALLAFANNLQDLEATSTGWDEPEIWASEAMAELIAFCVDALSTLNAMEEGYVVLKKVGHMGGEQVRLMRESIKKPIEAVKLGAETALYGL